MHRLRAQSSPQVVSHPRLILLIFCNADPDQGGFFLKRHPYTASETGGHKMSEGEILYLGMVIGGFVLFALVMGYVNLRQK
jgi:hypothetical protein